MMTDAVNENTKEEEETEESETDSEHEDPQPATNIRLLYFLLSKVFVAELLRQGICNTLSQPEVT